MKERVVFITAVGYPQTLPFAEYCFNTWQWWCRQNHVRLFILEKAVATRFPLPIYYQRYHAFEILAREGIQCHHLAVVDADTMIRWDCPDFFTLAGGKLGVVHEPTTWWTPKALWHYSELFPGLEVETREYFNSGFLVLENQPAHRQLFRDILEFRQKYRKEAEALETKKIDIDQTPLNYLVKKNRTPVIYLPQDFNLVRFIPGHYSYSSHYADMYPIEFAVDVGYIWHFAGFPRQNTLKFMRELWETIRHHYL